MEQNHEKQADDEVDGNRNRGAGGDALPRGGQTGRGQGGIEATRDAFAWFRQAAVAAGLPGLHLQLTYWNPNALNLRGVDSDRGSAGLELVTRLGFDSLSHYQYVHFTNIDRDYAAIMQDVVREWERTDAEFTIPYFPHVSVGWDNNPRFQNFRPGIVKDNTPEQIQKALELARDYADRHPAQAPLIRSSAIT